MSAGTKGIATAGAALVLAATCAVCQAQDWPARPIRMLVGFPPGGPTDVVARIVSDKVAAQINQRIVIDNRPGAAGNIAVEMLTKANADGHTLLYSSNAIALSPGLYTKLGYDPYKDITPVTEIGAGCLIFVVHPSLPAKTPQEFIDYAKARPGQLNYGSSGSGTSTHLAAVLFSLRNGLQTQHVPYKGTAPSLVDTVAGRVQFLMGAVLTAVPHVKEGRLRALGVTGTKRIKSLPDLRTLEESGQTGFVVTTWQGIFAPAGMSPGVLTKVNTAFAQAVQSADLRPRIEAQDMDPTGPDAKTFNKMYFAELKRWTKVAKDAGIKAD